MILVGFTIILKWLTGEDKKTSQKIVDVVEAAKAKMSETAGKLQDQAEVKKAEINKKLAAVKNYDSVH